MHWFQPLEQRILDWRKWRCSLSNDLQQSAQEIISFWSSSPLRKVSKLSDDPKDWPDPWKLFDSNSYCELMRGLGAFYSLCLHPELAKSNPTLYILYDDIGQRRTVVSLGDIVIGYIDDTDLTKILNTHQLLGKYTAEDFDFLKN